MSGALFCAFSLVLLLRATSEVRRDRDSLHLVRELEQQLDMLALSTLAAEPPTGQGSSSLASLRPLPRALAKLALEVDGLHPDVENGARIAPALAAVEAAIREHQGQRSAQGARRALPVAIEVGLRDLRSRAQATLLRADDAVDVTQDRLFVLAAILPSCMVFLLVALALRLRGRVLRPARVLEQAMEELRGGRWPEELQVRGLQELGGVTRTFNALAHDRRQLEETLRGIQVELESRVERRTSELAEANHSLAAEVEARRVTEERLRSSEQRFRRMFDVGPIGIAIVSMEGELLEANTRLEQLLGGGGGVMGRSLMEFCDAARGAQLREELRLAIATHQESFSTEVVISGTDGESRLVNLVASAVRAKTGELDYGLLMIRDISERRRAEELLLENERFAAMGRMAARIAHEINNPLGGIKNAFRLIKPAISLDHPFAHYVPRIDHEIDRVAGIVRQMYELYRPTSVAQQEFWIDEAVTDVVELLRVASPAAKLELDVRAARVRARLASGPLRQVLYNLIQNALEHSPEGSPVSVRAGVEGEQLVLIVEDRGEGISPEHRSRVFDSFFSTKEGRSSSGLGLGLAITHSAVEAMGGKVDFESQLELGTRFRVTIPLESANSSVLPSSSALAALPS